MLGCGYGVAARGVHDGDPFFGGRINVHIIQANAGPGNNFVVGGRYKQFRGHLGGTPDGEGIVFPDDLFEFFG